MDTVCCTDINQTQHNKVTLLLRYITVKEKNKHNNMQREQHCHFARHEINVINQDIFVYETEKNEKGKSFELFNIDGSGSAIRGNM